jgi:murein lipoprotein
MFRDMLLVPVLTLGLLAGCATRGSVDEADRRLSALESRVEGHERQMKALEDRLSEATSTAEQSVRRAEGAEAAARRAADSADDAARKADAIFRKSVSK